MITAGGPNWRTRAAFINHPFFSRFLVQMRIRSTWLNLTNDQFDEVERRSRDKGSSLLWRGAYEIGIPAAEHISPEAQPLFMELSFHLLLRVSHGRDAFLRMRIRKLRPSNSRCQPKFRCRLAAKSPSTFAQLRKAGCPRPRARAPSCSPRNEIV